MYMLQFSLDLYIKKRGHGAQKGEIDRNPQILVQAQIKRVGDF